MYLYEEIDITICSSTENQVSTPGDMQMKIVSDPALNENGGALRHEFMPIKIKAIVCGDKTVE